MVTMLILWIEVVTDNYQGEESDVCPRLELLHCQCLI